MLIYTKHIPISEQYRIPVKKKPLVDQITETAE